MKTDPTVKGIKRLAYAFVGLLAGDAVLLLYLLLNAILMRSVLLAVHMGEPAKQIPNALQMFVLYAGFSVAGWLLVGLPIALLLPARSITNMWWPLRVLVGATLGPLALFGVLAVLSRGHLSFPGSFRGLGLLWAFSALVSTVAFVAYASLLRKGRVVGV
jgi:hypothetical protein